VVLTALLPFSAPAAASRLADGATIDPDYSWVTPPPDLGRTNIIPIPTTVVLTREHPLITVATSDRQMVLRVDRDSLPDVPVVVTVTPLDPATLPHLPEDREPVGNAYRVDSTTLDHDPVTLAAAGVLVAPSSAGATYGLDGATWTRVGTDGRVQASTPQTFVLGRDTHSGGRWSALLVALLVTACGVACAGALLLVWRRRLATDQS
jgi:hypothetical protein